MEAKDTVKHFYTEHSNQFSNLTTSVQKRREQGVAKISTIPPNYIGTKNLKYWTRTIAGDCRRLVQLKHFSTVNMISGEFFKLLILMLFPTGLSFVDSQLKTIQ